MNRHVAVKLLFLHPHAVREILGVSASCEKHAVAATVVVVLALVGMVTDSGNGPHVVERPHDFLAHAVKTADSVERHETLVDPVETHDVGFLHPGMAVDVDGEFSGRHLEEVVAVKSVGKHDVDALQQERQAAHETCRHDVDIPVVAGFGVDDHFHVESLVPQGL